MKYLRVPTALIGVLALSVPSMLGCAAAGQDEWAPPAPASTSSPSSTISPPTVPLSQQQDLIPREPPAVSGGTLLVMADGRTAVAADSDRDVVWIVDLVSQSLLHTVKLQPGDEPGRVAEDAEGRVHVILRRGGAFVSIDPSTGEILARRPVCPAPRGLAHDASNDTLLVACADGRLFTFPPGGGGATRVEQLDSDLRDVIMQRGEVYVTTFRSAEILQVAPDGTIAQRIALPEASGPDIPTPPTGLPTPGLPPDPPVLNKFAPEVAWRTVPIPGGGLAVLHQRAQEAAVSTTPGGYTQPSSCEGVGIVQTAVTIVKPGTAPPVAPALEMMPLAVDVAVSPDGTQIAVVSASPVAIGPSTVARYSLSQLESEPSCMPQVDPVSVSQWATAVAFDGNGGLVVQVREPAAIITNDGILQLPGASALDQGHLTFHTATKAGVACASCHPEAGDDGRVWLFDTLGQRRTQNLRGGVLARTPFHWGGDIPDMDQLVQQVLVGRMGGNPLTQDQTDDLASWMNAQPALVAPKPADPASVARGKQTFEDPSVGCFTCHSGPQLSTHQLVDVGTGGVFKVPSLIAVGYRAPYLHDGCAATLQDRFSPACTTNQHGNTSQLSPDQIDDLVSYLESL